MLILELHHRRTVTGLTYRQNFLTRHDTELTSGGELKLPTKRAASPDLTTNTKKRRPEKFMATPEGQYIDSIDTGREEVEEEEEEGVLELAFQSWFSNRQL